MKAIRLIILIPAIGGLVSFGNSIAGEKDRDWEKEFLLAGADIGKQYEIVNEAMAAEKVPLGFLSDVINTGKFADLFPTYCVFRVFQVQTAMRMSKIATKDICEMLKEFYYGGSRSRILNRPTEYSFYAEWQKPVFEIIDSDGACWALTDIAWYGCANDLWLIKKKPGDDIWQGPWFTGFQAEGLPMIGVQESGFADTSPYSLRIADDGIHIISSDDTIDRLISPEALTSDSDDDGLYDVEEQRFGTDPRDDDTDGDGLIDGVDINPLAPGKKELKPWDYARMAVLMRDRTIGGPPMKVYYIDIAPEDSLEFRIPSPNALVLPINATQVVSEDCDCRSWGVFGQKISMGLKKKYGLMMEVSIGTGDHITSFCVEKLHGVWILTEERETIQY